jgi:hypothetical protein
MKIHELLDNESKWTKDCAAKDCFGFNVNIRSRVAVCWCLLGAIEKCYPRKPQNLTVKTKVYNALLKRYNMNSIIFFNDSLKTNFDNVRDLCLELDI